MITTAHAREQLILDLDDQFLKGGVVLSEWCTFIVRETDRAFVAGNYLPTILTAVAAIETKLRAEYEPESHVGLQRLTETSDLGDDLRARVHILRKYRNKWVHVGEPWNDLPLIHEPETFEQELEKMAGCAVRLLREVIYHDQWT